jgi:hypothetical protein
MAVRINQLNVKSTITSIHKEVLPLLGLSKSSVAVLGSTGKKNPKKNGTDEGSSGDIDLAISIPDLMKKHRQLKTFDDVYAFIVKAVSGFKEVNPMKGIKIVSIAFPIDNTDGLQDDKYVQLDIMPVASIEYSEWSYYSPAYNESKWKGLYRNELLYSCAKHANYKVLKKAVNDEGEEVDAEWERHFYDLASGLMKGRQSIEGKKGLVKSAKTLEKETVSLNPKEVTEFLFGPGISPKEVLTFEQALEVMLSDKFVYKDKLKKILHDAAHGIVDNKRVPLPNELKDYY